LVPYLSKLGFEKCDNTPFLHYEGAKFCGVFTVKKSYVNSAYPRLRIQSYHFYSVLVDFDKNVRNKGTVEIGNTFQKTHFCPF